MASRAFLTKEHRPTNETFVNDAYKRHSHERKTFVYLMESSC